MFWFISISFRFWWYLLLMFFSQNIEGYNWICLYYKSYIHCHIVWNPNYGLFLQGCILFRCFYFDNWLLTLNWICNKSNEFLKWTDGHIILLFVFVECTDFDKLKIYHQSVYTTNIASNRMKNGSEYKLIWFIYWQFSRIFSSSFALFSLLFICFKFIEIIQSVARCVKPNCSIFVLFCYLRIICIQNHR